MKSQHNKSSYKLNILNPFAFAPYGVRSTQHFLSFSNWLDSNIISLVLIACTVELCVVFVFFLFFYFVCFFLFFFQCNVNWWNNHIYVDLLLSLNLLQIPSSGSHKIPNDWTNERNKWIEWSSKCEQQQQKTYRLTSENNCQIIRVGWSSEVYIHKLWS